MGDTPLSARSERPIGVAVLEALRAWDAFCVDGDGFDICKDAMECLRHEMGRLVTLELEEDL
jgi:hypothetical protein